MRTIFNKIALLSVVLLGILFYTCSKSEVTTEEDKIRSVATNFVNAIARNDFESASKYADPATAQTLALIVALAEESGETLEDNSSQDLRILAVNRVEDTATVIFTDGTEEFEILMKKYGNDWKVSMDKEDIDKDK